jgi:hypothetical protein
MGPAKGVRAYNSESGTHLLVGNEPPKPLHSNVLAGDVPNAREKKCTLFMFAPKYMSARQKEWKLREPCRMYNCFMRKMKSSSRLSAWTMTPQPRVSYSTNGNYGGFGHS